LVITSIDIVDKDFNTITKVDLIYDTNNGIVYNNLTNTFNLQTKEYTSYYVKYTIRNTSNNSINSYIEILNNINVYQIATFDDLDEFGALISGRKVYIIDELPSNNFELNLPIAQLYAIQEEPNSRIKVLLPPLSSLEEPWYVSVANGLFFTSLRVTPSTSNIFKYNIPEFTTQNFNPEYPYKLRTSENAIRVSDNLVKVLKDSITYDPDNELHILVVLRNTDGTPRIVMSTDDTLIGTKFESTVVITSSIRSIDNYSGFIDITKTVLDTDTIEVTYYYQENEVEVLDVDFNPLSNKEILNYRTIFYVVPNTSNSRTKTIFNLKVDRTGKVISTNQADNTDLLDDITAENLYYNKDIFGPEVNFVDTYTLQSTLTPSVNNPKYFVIGEISTNENSYVSQAVFMDIRRQGGGIKTTDGLIEQLALLNSEIIWTHDVATWDGLPYPGTGAFSIEIPSTVQEVNGGLLNDIAIREIIERHTAFGVYPAIRTYGGPDIILSAVPHTTSIDLSWNSFGSSYKYNIYLSTTENGTYTLINSSPIIDNLSGNVYTVTNLTSDTLYWIYATIVDDNSQSLVDSIIGMDPIMTYQNPNKITLYTV